MKITAGFHEVPDFVQHSPGSYDVWLIECEKTMKKEGLRCLEVTPEPDVDVKTRQNSLNRASKRLGLGLTVKARLGKIYLVL